MPIAYDEARLRHVLTDFYNATGVSIQLIRPDLSRLLESAGTRNHYCDLVQKTADGKRACLLSDEQLLRHCRDTQQMQIHVCHAGLIDIAVPIIYEGEILAYIILGQLKKETSFDEVRKLINALPIDVEEMAACYSTLTVYDKDRVKSVANIASMLSKYILLEHLLTPNYNNATERAVTYINAHADQPLSVKKICSDIHVSKSVLYKNLHATFGCTVSEYINARRIENAATLLHTTSLSVEEIAQCVGFSSSAYFSKVFKKQKGISPLKFRFAQKK